MSILFCNDIISMSDRVSYYEFLATTDVKNTQRGYRSGVCGFLEFIYDIPFDGHRNKEHIQVIQDLSLKYLDDADRNHATDLSRYLMFLKDKGRAPYSIRNLMSTVFVWFEWNDIVITPKKLKLIKQKLPRAKPITKKEKGMSPEIIRDIIAHLDIHYEAVLLTLMSSGMRIGEICSITFDDIDLSSDPVRVNIRDEITKTRTERFTFISAEAADMIRSWLKERDAWLLKVSQKSKNLGKPKPITDDRVFPFSPCAVNQAFNRALKASGYYETSGNNRATIHPHLFRGYFISKLHTAGMTPNIVEMLAGHAPKYHGAYDIYSDEQIRDEYNKAYYAISLYSPENMPEIKQELQTQEEAIKSMAAELAKLKRQMFLEAEERMREYDRLFP